MNVPDGEQNEAGKVADLDLGRGQRHLRPVRVQRLLDRQRRPVHGTEMPSDEILQACNLHARAGLFAAVKTEVSSLTAPTFRESWGTGRG